MAYWQVRIDTKSSLNECLQENKWELTTNAYIVPEIFKDIIDLVQVNDILFLVDFYKKINYYARCSKNELNGRDIQVTKWENLSYEVNALTSDIYADAIININNNKKINELLEAIKEPKTAYNIDSIKINNFRLIENLEIKFDKSINVIIANNGIGKTTVLDAISIGYGAMLTRFPHIKGLDFKDRDLQVTKENKSKPYMNIKIKTTQNIVWDRTTKRDKSKKTASLIPNSYGLRELNSFVDSIVDSDNENKDYIMPLIMYYGTCRNCFETPMRKTNFQKEFSRFESLSGSLVSSTNFSRLFQWFVAMENIELKEQKEQKDFNYLNRYLVAVRDAITSMMPEFSNPKTDTYPLRFMIDKQNEDGTITKLQIEQLSAGYKAVLAMTMDISARMVEANISLGNSSKAIILIDELDLHLHPTWQQTILTDLARTFPNAQFIVTTHSPHIIGSVESKYIKILEKRDDNIELVDGAVTYGREMKWILQQMGLESIRPKVVKEKFDSCQNLLSDEKYDEAEIEINELEEMIKQDDREVMSLRNTLFFERD